MSNKIDSIVIHCSATPEGREVTAKEIEGWHKEKGYKAIGYNYVIKLDGTVETGRPHHWAGAHCTNKGKSGLSYNYHSLGVCYVGGLAKDGKTPKDTRTPAQKAALENLLKELVAQYPQIKSILGHRDCGAKKACPCFDAIPEYSHLLNK